MKSKEIEELDVILREIKMGGYLREISPKIDKALELVNKLNQPQQKKYN